jgi:NAD(P)-dependent dehydrogenase (short-subunit alcohol dehydrogenase family)
VAPADFARVLDVNVIGTQFGMAAAVARMRQAGAKGVILNLASTASFRGAGAYSGSKWAVRGLTSGLGNVLGPEGIRVVAMAPTVTDTPGIAPWTGADDEGGMVERVVAGIPLGRMGEPDDVARLAVFLASDAAAFITATTVVVDGGSLASL